VIVNITNSALSGNTATNKGGGIVNFEGTLTVADSTISGNTGGSGAGGVYTFSGGVFTPVSTIANSTIAGNFAPTGGGILNGTHAVSTIENTVIAVNTANSSPDVSGTVNSQGHNLIGIGDGGSGFDPTDLVGTAGNLIDPLLGPLQDNGGPTPTMALLPGSPAIGAGDPTGASAWDQRGPGFPRVVNGLTDIGAFEVQPTVTAPTVTASLAKTLLWPANHHLVNVGLGVDVTPADAALQVQVYANDNATAADARDIGPDTLRLRAKRTGEELGRVYLIVVTASNSAGSAFDVAAVVVPRHNNALDIAIVRLEAFLAEGWYRLFQTAPPGFHFLGEGSSPSPLPSRHGAGDGVDWVGIPAARSTGPTPLLSWTPDSRLKRRSRHTWSGAIETWASPSSVLMGVETCPTVPWAPRTASPSWWT
jgi:hypothetical protein